MSATTVPTPSEIIESFPEPVSKIKGKPTYGSLSTLRDALKANAASVGSSLGGGGHGHLGLILPTAIYNTIVAPIAPAVNSWTDPVYPGAQPNIPGNASAVNAANQRAAHADRLRTFLLNKNVNAALRKQILEAVDEVYLKPLRQPHIGYSNRPARDMLQHLFTTYGKISPHNLAQNNINFERDWDPSSPIELLFDQIDTCQEYATDGNQPYTDAQILNNAYNLVFKSGSFFEDCRRWNARAAADKTYANFKTFFTDAYKNLQLQHTASQAGLNAMEIQKQQQQLIDIAGQYFTKQDQLCDITNTFAEAMSQAKDDHTALSTLTSTNAENNKALLKLINEVRQEITELKKRYPMQVQQLNNRRQRKDQGSYCHTHGFLVHKNHNSMNCKNPGPNHCREATRENTMGGSQEGKPGK